MAAQPDPAPVAHDWEALTKLAGQSGPLVIEARGYGTCPWCMHHWKPGEDIGPLEDEDGRWGCGDCAREQ